MKKAVFLFYIFLQFAVCFLLFAGEDSVYVIRSFVYEVDGITRPFALNSKAQFREGEEITGLSNLHGFIQNKTQILINERVLESVRIEHHIDTPGNNGKYPVDLVIYIKDSRNFIVLPQPQYSTNSGLSLYLKARDYNFLGTMNPLRIDLGYRYNEHQQHFYSLLFDSDTPFRAFGLNWNFDFDHFLEYRPHFESPLYYRNTTGLSVQLPFKRTLFIAGFSQSLYINEENWGHFWEEYGQFQELYMSSRPYFVWIIPTGIKYYDLGEVHYIPSFSATFNYGLPQWPLADYRIGPELNFSHSLSFGRIDWIGNFKRGASFGLSNSIGYNFYQNRIDGQPWSSNINFTGTGFFILNDYTNFSGRLMYRHWFFDAHHGDGGDVIRGIPNHGINTDYMLSLNLDLNFFVLKVRSSELFPNSKFMSIFDADIHLVPILDIAFYNDPITHKPFGLENMLIGSGFELIVYSSRWRSLYLRGSAAAGIQTGNFGAGLSREIYIGMEFHY